MSQIDKLKLLAGGSPLVSDVTQFINDEFAGNDRANQKITTNSALLKSMQRESDTQLRDAITGVIVQDSSGIIARQSVLSQTVGDLVGLQNKIDIAALTTEQDAAMARLSQTNKYTVAQLKGDLNVEMAGVDGEIDLEIATVVAASKSDIATQIGNAEHDGEVAIEQQTSLNNITLAQVEKDNAIKIGTVRGDFIVKSAVIDAGIISKESDIEIAGVKSASAVAATGILKERKYDADLIRMEANEGKHLTQISASAETTNLSTLGSLNVRFIADMAQTEMLTIEQIAAIEAKSTNDIAVSEAKSTDDMAIAESGSIIELNASEVAAIRSNAFADASFIKNMNAKEIDSLSSLADKKKQKDIADADSEVKYMASRASNQRDAISNDFILADTLAANLSKVEIQYNHDAGTKEVEQIGAVSVAKIANIAKSTGIQKGYINSVSALEVGQIKSNADIRFASAKEYADMDYTNKVNFYNNVESKNIAALHAIETAAYSEYERTRVSMQAEIDNVEVSEISQISRSDANHISKMAIIETNNITSTSDLEISGIQRLAEQRHQFVMSQSDLRMSNEKSVSEMVNIPSIKNLSALKITEYNDRNKVEKEKYDALTPEMIRAIDEERIARVNQINSDSISRFNAAKNLVDSQSQVEINNTTKQIAALEELNKFQRDVSAEIDGKVNKISKETAFYAANTVHRREIHKNSEPVKDTYPGEYIENPVISTPIPNFK